MKRSLIHCPAILLCALLLPLAAQPERPLAEILPGDAMVSMTARDLTALRPWFEGEAGILKEPAVREMLKEVGLDAETLKREFVEEMKIPLDEFLDVLRGPAGASLFIRDDGDSEVPDFVLVFGVERGERSEALWRKLRARMEDEAGIERISEEDIRGVPVWMLEKSRSEDDEETPPDRAWLCLEEGAFLVSTQRDLMERTLLALQGRELPTPTIIERKDYSRAIQHLGVATDFMLFVDLPAVLKQESSGEEDDEVMQALGFDAVTGLWMGLGTTEDAVQATFYADAPGARRGVMKLLSPECGPLKPDRFAPADARQAGVVWIDPRTLLAEIRGMILLTGGEDAVEMMDAGIQMLEDNVGIQLQDDLMALLEPPLYFVEMPSPAASDESIELDRTVYYMRSPDTQRLQESFGNLMEAASDFGLELSEKEYLGHTITYLDIEMPEGFGPGGAEMPQPAFATTKSHAFLSLGGTAPIERALRTIGKEVQPLSATADYQRAMAGLPERSWIVGFARLGDALAEVTTLLSGLGDMIGEDLPASVRAFINDADADFWRRHIDVMGVSVSSDDSGIAAALRILGPEKAKEPKPRKELRFR